MTECGRGDGRQLRGLGVELGEIPAASAGMTDLACAGVTDLWVRVWWFFWCGRGGFVGAGVTELWVWV